MSKTTPFSKVHSVGTTCLIDGVCFDTTATEDLIAASALTALGVGMFGGVAKEKAFIQPFIYAMSAASICHYTMPTSSNAHRPFAVGAGMAGMCAMIADGSTEDCLKYGAVAALSNYIATQYVLPELGKVL